MVEQDSKIYSRNEILAQRDEYLYRLHMHIWQTITQGGCDLHG